MDFLPVPIQTLLKSKSFATLWTAKPIFLINIAVTLFYEIWLLYVRTLYLRYLLTLHHQGWLQVMLWVKWKGNLQEM